VCCSVLQCVAVCCSVLQCVAVCCSVLLCVAVLHCVCSVLQSVAECCSVLQCALTKVCHNSSICVPWSVTCASWLIFLCAMTCVYMCLKSFMSVPRLIHLCVMTHPCACHDSSIPKQNEWVMSHIWISHASHMTHVVHISYVDESCFTYECVMSHMWMSHVSHMNQSCITRDYEWVVYCTWMSHVPQTNPYYCSQHDSSIPKQYEWVMSHIWMSHVSHMNESCLTFEWVMSHIRMSYVAQTMGRLRLVGSFKL